MFRVLGCITQQHNLRLVAVAAVICCFASFTTINMLWRSANHRNLARICWIAGASLNFSLGIWTTHFVSMLAFNAPLIIGYDEVSTILSLIMAVCGSTAAFSLLIRGRESSVDRGLAGVVAAIAIAAMHFTGVGAIRAHGSLSFDINTVIAAIVTGGAFSGIGLVVAGRLDQSWRRNIAAAALAVSVVSLHFTGMAAIAIQPGAAVPIDGMLIGSAPLTILVIVVTGLMLFIGLVGSIIDYQVSLRLARDETSMNYIVRHDPLTGLPNRLQSLAWIDDVLAARREAADAGTLTLCLLDLDNFKQVNDLQGHQAGDQVLIQVAARLQALMERDDLIGRADGDAYIVATAPRGQHVPAALATRILSTLHEPFVINDRPVRIGASMGVALFPQDGNDAGQLLQNADTALHQAKNDGRGQYRFFERAMNERLLRQQQLEQDLRQALEEGQFELHYQPLLDGRSRQVAGFEALARWNHPKRGQISPTEFISVAEEAGLIVSLGRWVLEKACSEAASWENPLRVAVNLSPVQFRQPDLGEMIVGILQQTGLAPERLELEVTESVLIQHAEQAVNVLSYLREFGVRISLDDFGTGYSSLSYLRRLPLHKIKIDRSFIQALGQDKEAAVITRAIIALGHSLSLEVTAEGVETESQLAFLEAEDCNQMQGYLIGRPSRSDGVEHLTRSAAAQGSPIDAPGGVYGGALGTDVSGDEALAEGLTGGSICEAERSQARP
jgi:diguanylate cyclase